MAGHPGLPTSVADLTPEWFSSVLGKPVIGVEVQALGDGVGFLGQTFRARLTSAQAADSPSSVIVKVAADGPAREVASSMGLYEREVRFYSHIAQNVGVMVPECSLADIDVETGLFVLVLSDLSPARAGDQLIGATDDEIAAAVATAARLHAKWWNSPALSNWTWLPSQAALIRGTLERSATLYPAFAEAWSGEFSDEELKLGEKVALHLGSLVDAVDHPPFTLVHGDYRLDNLFFSSDGDVAVIDWQLPFRGYSGTFDIVLLLSSSLTPEGRSRLLASLERTYLEELAKGGISGFSHDDLRTALAVAAGQLLARCPIAHQIPSPNERAAKMRARLFRGYFDMAQHAALGELLP